MDKERLTCISVRLTDDEYKKIKVLAKQEYTIMVVGSLVAWITKVFTYGLGHADVNITYNIYVHLYGDGFDEMYSALVHGE